MGNRDPEPPLGTVRFAAADHWGVYEAHRDKFLMTKVTIAKTRPQRPFARALSQPNISGVMNMLTLVDLHQNEELSVSSMGKIAGGDKADACNASALAEAASNICRYAGFDDAAGYLAGLAEEYAYQGENCR